MYAIIKKIGFEPIFIFIERRDTVKSFRLVSLQVVTSEEELVNIELIEGLIINKEDEQNRWLIEGFLHEKHYDLLLGVTKDRKRVPIQAVITKKENSPASFDTEVLTIKKVENFYSVLFEGSIIHSHNNYGELLLEHLVDEGFNGEALVDEFKKQMKTKPRFASNKAK